MKPEKYFSHKRHDILELVPGEAKRILEVGCAEGLNGEELCSRGASVIGIEIDPHAAETASKRLTRVYIGDVEKTIIDERDFDIILYPDVLEHLIDPWTVIRRHADWLVPGGRMIASIPNLRFYRVLRNLIRGKFEYSDAGIMDRSHLRFFTRDSAIDMFLQSELEIENIVRNFHSKAHNLKILNSLFLGAFKEFIVYQYLIVARKPTR